MDTGAVRFAGHFASIVAMFDLRQWREKCHPHQREHEPIQKPLHARKVGTPPRHVKPRRKDSYRRSGHRVSNAIGFRRVGARGKDGRRVREDANIDAYEPLPAWLGMVRYYGELVRRPGWERLFPLFDLVKQLSTSRVSLEFTPSLDGDVLVLTRNTSAAGREPDRLTVDVTPERELLFRQYLPGDPTPRWLQCPHEQAFNTLSRILLPR